PRDQQLVAPSRTLAPLSSSSGSLLSRRTLLVFFFFFYSSGHHRDLHSFPTRRSSDLRLEDVAVHRGEVRGAFAAARLLHDATHADRKSTRLNSSHVAISYAVFCLKKKKVNGKVSPRDPGISYSHRLAAASRQGGRYDV